jgi:hypothetical protein
MSSIPPDDDPEDQTVIYHPGGEQEGEKGPGIPNSGIVGTDAAGFSPAETEILASPQAASSAIHSSVFESSPNAPERGDASPSTEAGIDLLQSIDKEAPVAHFDASAHINIKAPVMGVVEEEDATSVIQSGELEQNLASLRDPPENELYVESKISSDVDPDKREDASLGNVAHSSANQDIDTCDTHKELPAYQDAPLHTQEIDSFVESNMIIDRDDSPTGVYVHEGLDESIPLMEEGQDAGSAEGNPGSDESAHPAATKPPVPEAPASTDFSVLPLDLQQALDGIDSATVAAQPTDKNINFAEAEMGTGAPDPAQDARLPQAKEAKSSGRKQWMFPVTIAMVVILFLILWFFAPLPTDGPSEEASAPALGATQTEVPQETGAQDPDAKPESTSTTAAGAESAVPGVQEETVEDFDADLELPNQVRPKSTKRNSGKKRTALPRKKERKKNKQVARGWVQHYRIKKSTDSSKGDVPGLGKRLRKTFQRHLKSAPGISFEESRGKKETGYVLLLFLKKMKTKKKGKELTVELTCSMIASKGASGGMRLSTQATTAAATTTSAPASAKPGLANDALAACGAELAKDFINYVKKARH